MAVNPQGIGVQAAYRWYRNGQLQVNRRYQRKLVWTIEEKISLIESIIREYPIPQFIFAELRGESRYEIIDGVQRLNAIFSFIENGFPVDGAYFDVNQLARARQAIEDGEVNVELSYPRPVLLPDVCANIIDYQLAVTIFPADNEERINEIFGRINSGGRQLSQQDKRQAGSVSAFNEVVRTIASKIRGDDSTNPVDLRVMPAISIELPSQTAGYAIRAQDVFWCRQGIARATELRQSADEQVIADLLAAMLFEEPIENNAEALDEIYDPDTDLGKLADRAILDFGQDALVKQFLSIIDVAEEVVKVHPTQSAFRDIVYPRRTSNPMRASFHAFSALSMS